MKTNIQKASKYLMLNWPQSPVWRDMVGEGTTVEWPTGVGGKGNEGVAVFVSQIKNSIGYVEYAYALHHKMTFGLVKNRAGRFIKPDSDSFRAAANTADWENSKDFYFIMTDAAADNAYPITATVFILMYKTPRDAVRTKAAIDFFEWALDQGQTQASELDYVTLPIHVVKQVQAYWKAAFGSGF
jgi:phosphate transport system substrate-binding protein